MLRMRSWILQPQQVEFQALGFAYLPFLILEFHHSRQEGNVTEMSLLLTTTTTTTTTTTVVLLRFCSFLFSRRDQTNSRSHTLAFDLPKPTNRIRISFSLPFPPSLRTEILLLCRSYHPPLTHGVPQYCDRHPPAGLGRHAVARYSPQRPVFRNLQRSIHLPSVLWSCSLTYRSDSLGRRKFAQKGPFYPI